MKTNLCRALLIVVAFVGLVLVVPAQAVAAPWCSICDDTDDCFACCRCAGGSPGTCFQVCGFNLTASEDVSFLTPAACDDPLMSVATPIGETAELEAAAIDTAVVPDALVPDAVMPDVEPLVLVNSD